jgi:hypothetical protein|tara:strand:- start:178 stop:465 length:288 start_codon:yes stop_codon:yes gene_type:complete
MPDTPKKGRLLAAQRPAAKMRRSLIETARAHVEQQGTHAHGGLPPHSRSVQHAKREGQRVKPPKITHKSMPKKFMRKWRKPRKLTIPASKIIEHE